MGVQCGVPVRVEGCVCDWCGCRVCAGVWGRCVSVHTAVSWDTLVRSVSREGKSHESQTPLWNRHGPGGADELEQPLEGLVTWRPGSEGRGCWRGGVAAGQVHSTGTVKAGDSTQHGPPGPLQSPALLPGVLPGRPFPLVGLHLGPEGILMKRNRLHT